MNERRPIRLALIGAGNFARDVHIPSIRALGNTFEVVAVYSRTRSTLSAIRELLPASTEYFTDLNSLLNRDDIDLVDILLPIGVMPDIVEVALRAGKHVISEKPIAPDTTIGRRLLATYAQHRQQVWMVGENWRYEDAFVQAARLVDGGVIGAPVSSHWSLFLPVKPGTKYYETAWRRSGTFPGGFLMDGGVHHIAALRLIMGEIVQVSAEVNQVSSALPPADTMAATLRFASGAVGTYNVSYAVWAPWPPVLYIVGERGCLSVERGDVRLTQDGQTQQIPCQKFNAARDQFAALAATIRHGAPHLNQPEQGLQDVAVVEAMLRSGASGAPAYPQRFV